MIRKSSTSSASSSKVTKSTSSKTVSSNNVNLTRLDAYLPALNTGHMDGKIQDVIIKHPLVRSLIIPECDLEARRRCIRLVTRILEAATPILPLLLSNTKGNGSSNSAAISKLRHEASMAMGGQTLPNLQLPTEARNRLIAMVSSLAERDSLVRFWFNHYTENLGSSQSNLSPSPDGMSPPGQYNHRPLSAKRKGQETTLALYLRVKSGKENLADLADRIQGAVCKAFWETWDDIFITLADIIGCDEMQAADSGRIFRPCGDAAIYINNHKITKKREMEEQRRKSLVKSGETQQYQQQQQSLAGLGVPSNARPRMPSVHVQQPHHPPPPQQGGHSGSHGLTGPLPSQSPMPFVPPSAYGGMFDHDFFDTSLLTTNENFTNDEHNSNNNNNNSSSNTSNMTQQPARFNSSQTPKRGSESFYPSRYPVSPPKSNGSPEGFGTDDVDGDLKIPLSNSADLIMQDIYTSDTQGAMGRGNDDHLFNHFTTLDDQQQGPPKHVDLRQRIKMMEEGKAEVLSPNSQVIW